MSIFATCLNTSPARYEVLAVPAEEKLSAPGFCRASAMKSEMVLAWQLERHHQRCRHRGRLRHAGKVLHRIEWRGRVITLATGWPLEVSISV